jgi:hypothetical protein
MVVIENSFAAIIVSLPMAVVVYFVAGMLMPGGHLRLKEIFSDFMFIFKKEGSR